jgi:HJR/Mrr/RecB family endonuclease
MFSDASLIIIGSLVSGFVLYFVLIDNAELLIISLVITPIILILLNEYGKDRLNKSKSKLIEGVIKKKTKKREEKNVAKRIDEIISQYKRKLANALKENPEDVYGNREEIYNDCIESISSEYELSDDEEKRLKKEFYIHYKNLYESFIRESSKDFYDKYEDWIEKFLGIAERKVSALDEYGDPNWDAMYEEISVLISKIASAEGYSKSQIKEFVNHYLDVRGSLGYERYFPASKLNKTFWALVKRLEALFKNYYRFNKDKIKDEIDFNKLSGVEFEAYVGKVFKNQGFDVRGTKKTGDQGADLIAKKGKNTIIIQVKRYRGSVGNKAVQEVVSAIKHYRGTEGWVVTNSKFTKSAKYLAQSNDVKLVSGWELKKKINNNQK